MTSTYEYHRYQLQYLGYHFKGKRWVLKAPIHLLFLRYLFEVYPDARIIQLHRDPLKVIPSMCSLVAMSRAIHSNHVNITETAKQLLELMSININRSIAYRDSISPDQILDISFTELVENTMATINRIYTWLMEDFKPETETAMSSWLHQSRLKRSGKPHKYSLDQFGFNDAQIQDCFAQYYERYADYL